MRSIESDVDFAINKYLTIRFVHFSPGSSMGQFVEKMDKGLAVQPEFHSGESALYAALGDACLPMKGVTELEKLVLANYYLGSMGYVEPSGDDIKKGRDYRHGITMSFWMIGDILGITGREAHNLYQSARAKVRKNIRSKK